MKYTVKDYETRYYAGIEIENGIDIIRIFDALNDILPPLGYGASYLDVRNTTGLTIQTGTPVFISGSVSGKSLIEKYNPSSVFHNPDVPILGLVKSNILNNTNAEELLSGVNNSVKARGIDLSVLIKE